MKIVITGGAGFIGSQLGHYLSSAGHSITLLDDMSFGNEDNLRINGHRFGHFQKVDVRNKLDQLFENTDVVFHFAGISSLPECQSNPIYALDVNVTGTANVLESCRKAGVKKIVFSSTSAVYENNKSTPFREADAVQPNLIYSISKLQGEHLCRSYVDNYGMDVSVIRFFNVYGAHQDFKRTSPPLMGYITRELLLNKSPIFHSSGHQRRDYINIQDIVLLCELAMNRKTDSFEIYNACAGTTYSVREIFAIFQKHLNKEDIQPIFRDASLFWEKYPDLHKGRFKLDPQVLTKEVEKCSLGDPTLAKTVFGWKASKTLEEGVKEICSFVKDNLDRYKVDL